MPFSVLERPFLWKHMLASGGLTSQVSSISGLIHTLTINRGDPHAGCVVTLYDAIGAGDAAHVIATIVLDTALYTVPTTLVFDCEFQHGLYVEFDAAATLADITISYM